MKLTKSGRPLACALAVLPALVLTAQHALAAGFAIKEQSGAALGNAFAGSVTGIDDLSYSFYNPAMMTYLSGNHAAVSGSYIIPNSEFQDGSASTVLGAPINPTGRFEGNDDIGRNALVPAVYGMWSFDENLKFGLSVTAPFGLLTDNPDGWIGRYHALKSELTTFDINPMVAYRVMPGLSVGAGFRAVYADAELSNAVDFNTIQAVFTPGPPLPLPADLTDGRAKLQGDDWGFGFNFGIMYEPVEKLRLGVAYRSFVDIDIDGDTKFDLDQAGIGAALQAGFNLFRDTDATAAVELPDSVAFGANYDITDEWSVMAQAEWWNWSRFDELKVEFSNPVQPDSITEEDWNDSWFFGVGTTYRPKQVEGLTVRFGLAFDESPIPDKTRTPRIPGEDRYWIAAGVGYTPLPWLTFDLGYTHIFIPDAEINLSASDPGSTFRGNLSGEYEAHIDIVALQATARF